MNSKKVFSATLPILAILIFVTPFINVILIPDAPNQLLISGLMLFIFWFLIIIAAFQNYLGYRTQDHAPDYNATDHDH